MSFGFSLGDFLTVGKLVADITTSLREAGGAKSEYQELIRELNGLQKALEHVDKLQSNESSQQDLVSIKFAALSCRQPLEEFLSKVRKYERSLGITRHGSSVLRGTVDKLKWAFGKKEEIWKLQCYLNVHVGTINMLLAQFGLDKMDVATAKVDEASSQVRERLDTTQRFLQSIQDQAFTQAQVVRHAHSMLVQLFRLVNGELRTSWMSLADMVSKVCVSTQQIYGVVLELRALATVDTRWTFFQAPLVVEDALGFKFPVPSEYSYELLIHIIHHRFQDGEGARDVEADNFELCKRNNSKDIITEQFRLLPGTEIIMAIIVERPTWTLVSTEELCPMPRCESAITTVAPAGGRTCSKCNVWFDLATKERNTLQDFFRHFDDKASEKNDGKIIQRESNQNHNNQYEKKDRESGVEAFRNIKWAVDKNEESKNEDHTDVKTELVDSETPILNEALAFLDLVKVTYRNSPSQLDRYERLLQVMKGFKSGLYDTPGVMKHTTTLFMGEPKLVFGFSSFLPPGYRTDLITELDCEGYQLVAPTGPLLSLTLSENDERLHALVKLLDANLPDFSQSNEDTAQNGPTPQADTRKRKGSDNDDEDSDHPVPPTKRRGGKTIQPLLPARRSRLKRGKGVQQGVNGNG